ncbi:hypothetical protein KDW87_15890 [Burkholderia cenocepacia]|nr:hypothetical protein [Burkholderia cenocepacia]MCW3635775.1 hypothetical protein [Burkholderia cenocepacia]QUN55265.1 hypothetical protein KEH58_03595 [Burkholderia cenocepacia]
MLQQSNGDENAACSFGLRDRDNREIMSISEIFRVVGTDITESGQVPVSALRKPKILSIGGCVTEVLAGRMNRLADVTHLWRVTVPCLMSKKVEGRTYFESDDHQLSERINFELTKQALRKLKTGGYEFLIFDPTSDFNNDYYEKDGCIISDMETIGLAPNWKWPDGFVDAGWVKISPGSYHYLEIYFHYLKELISLAEEIGLPLVIMKRRTCVNKITHDGMTGLGDPTSTEINWWVDLLWKKIDSLLGRLNVLDLNGRFAVTSFDVPFGEGKFHPIDEFYDYAAYKLMGLMRLGDDLISEVMFNVYRDRASRRLAIHSERDGLVRERDELVRGRGDLIHERDVLTHERDALRFALENLTAERDCILARETENARIASENHSRELTALSAARDAALAESVANAQARDNLQRSYDELSHQHGELCAQQSRLFNDLKLEGGPMALREVLPLARAWRPVIRCIGKIKRSFRRLVGHSSNDPAHRSELHGQ